eukprot:15472481-Alexandrium_andersonii.AAC.1
MVFSRGPRDAMFATPTIRSHYGDPSLAHPPSRGWGKLGSSQWDPVFGLEHQIPRTVCALWAAALPAFKQ